MISFHSYDLQKSPLIEHKCFYMNDYGNLLHVALVLCPHWPIGCTGKHGCRCTRGSRHPSRCDRRLHRHLPCHREDIVCEPASKRADGFSHVKCRRTGEHWVRVERRWCDGIICATRRPGEGQHCLYLHIHRLQQSPLRINAMLEPGVDPGLLSEPGFDPCMLIPVLHPDSLHLSTNIVDLGLKVLHGHCVLAF